MNVISHSVIGKLHADETEIRSFVDALFRYADTGTLVGLRSFPHDKLDQTARIQGWAPIQGDNAALISAAVKAATQSANDPKGLVFAPPIATFWATQEPDSFQRARLIDLANGLCVSVELDEGDIDAAKRKLEHLLGPVTVSIASGGVWINPLTGEIHNKLHLHWRLSEPTRAPEDHARLKTARNLAMKLVGADPTAVPLVHPLRWPGSWHCKSTPRLAKIETCNPDFEIHLDDALTTLEEAAKAAKIDLGDTSNGPRKPGEPQASPARVASAVMAIPNLDTTSWDDWNKMGLLIHRATGGGSDGLNTWIDWSQKSGKYVAGECQARWDHFHSHPYSQAGFGTIYHMATAHGWVEARPSKPTSQPPEIIMDEFSGAYANGSHAAPMFYAEHGADDAKPVSNDEVGETHADVEPHATTAKSAADLVVEEACRLSDAEFLSQRLELTDRIGMMPNDLTKLRNTFLAEKRKADRARERAETRTAAQKAKLEEAYAKQDVKEKAAAKKKAAEEKATKERHEKIQAAYEAAKPDVEKLVERFNAEFMIVNEAGKALVYQRGEHAVLNRRVFHRLSTSDLKTLYMNERIAAGADSDGNSKMRNVASVWLNHTNRRQYIKGVAFDPTNKTPAGVLNLWEGFGTKPAPGNWSLLKDHIKTIVCSKNQKHYDYLMNWLARLVQFPAQQGEVAVVMRGVEGCGKGTLASAVKTMIGHHALGINNAKHLVGNFNQHLRDVVFLFADEAFFAGDKQHIGVLKSLITESSITIEGKYINATEFPNYLHVMMASNEEWVVPADLRSRRFFVLNVPDTKVGDFLYFEKIRKQLDAGGYAAMLHELLNRDISAFNVRNIPNSEGLEQQRHLSLDTLHAWWLDCLERGYVFRSKIGLEEIFGVWDGDFYSTELLFASYLEFAKSRNERRPHNRVQLGKFMVDMSGRASRQRNRIVGEHIVEDEDATGRLVRRARSVTADHPPGYVFGNLDDARKAFVEKTTITIVWDNGANEEPPAANDAQVSAAEVPTAAKPAWPSNPYLTH